MVMRHLHVKTPRLSSLVHKRKAIHSIVHKIYTQHKFLIQLALSFSCLLSVSAVLFMLWTLRNETMKAMLSMTF